MSEDKISENVRNVAEELFNKVEKNTQFDDDKNKVTVARLNMPSEIINYLLDHYGLFDLVEVNQMALYVLKCLGKIEDDGWTLVIHKVNKDESGNDKSEAYRFDIHDLIAKFRIEMAKSINKSKETKNEKDNL